MEEEERGVPGIVRADVLDLGAAYPGRDRAAAEVVPAPVAAVRSNRYGCGQG